MKHPMSRQSLLVIFIFLVTGAAIAAFLLIGPPQLLARSESPEFCAYCHLHEDHYAAWRHEGAHRGNRCVDCHLPNDNPANHYLWKGIDGMKDVIMFYSGMIPETIALTKHGQRVLLANCIKCHEEKVSMMDTTRTCWQCHRQTNHRLTGIIADQNQIY